MAKEPASERLDLGFLDAVGDGELRGSAQDRVYRDFMRAMYVLVKSAFVYDVNNDAMTQAAERLSKYANRIRAHSDDEAALEFLVDGAYVNRSLIKLDASSYDQADYLFAVWSTVGVAEVAAVADTTPQDWLDLISAFQHAVGPDGDFQSFSKLEFPCIRLTSVITAGTAENSLAVTDRFRALRAYSITVITLGELIDSARAGRRLRPARVKRPLQEMISLSKKNASLLLALAHLKRHKITFQHHLANTAVFVISAIRKLDLTRSVACEVAMQAALHDIGRAFVAGEPTASGPMAERAFALQAVRKLVAVGSTNTRMLGRVVVANEVRRWADRSLEPPGDTVYPFDIGMSTKLVAAAHAYSLLTTPTRDRPCLLADEALRVIMRDAGRRYDSAAVKLLVNALGVYPVGSTVALSDGRAAIVVEAPHEAAGPTQPRVKIVRDAQGELIDGPVIDLSGDAGAELRIVKCVDAEHYEINPPAFLLG